MKDRESGHNIVDILEKVDLAAIGVGVGLMTLGSISPPLGILGAEMIVASGVTLGISKSQFHKK